MQAKQSAAVRREKQHIPGANKELEKHLYTDSAQAYMDSIQEACDQYLEADAKGQIPSHDEEEQEPEYDPEWDGPLNTTGIESEDEEVYVYSYAKQKSVKKTRQDIYNEMENELRSGGTAVAQKIDEIQGKPVVVPNAMMPGQQISLDPMERVQRVMWFINGGASKKERRLRGMWCGWYMVWSEQGPYICYINMHRLHKVTGATNAEVRSFLKFNCMFKVFMQKPIEGTHFAKNLEANHLSPKGWVRIGTKCCNWYE